MTEKVIGDLLRQLDYTCICGSVEEKVTDVVYDSRKVEKDSAFVCISGAVCDGHDFAQEVAKKGAAVLFIEKDVEVPEDVTVIRVQNTRLALAQTSAAYFRHPAKELITNGLSS